MLANQMNNMLAEGGVMQEGGTVDPVSGNDVPPGAMAEEVRDDIDAKLSEGEFVIPADVVRYIGLEKLMMMRDKAKAGLKRMNDIGQMGNAEEVEDAEALHGGEDEMDDETFSSEIDSIIGEEGKQEYSAGGDVRKYAPGGYVGGETNKELYRDAPIRGFEMVAMTNDAGQTIYIPFINGKPQLAIPQGYRVRTSDVTATPTTPTVPTTGGGDSGGGDGGDSGGAPTAPSSPGFSIGEEGFAVANETSTTTGSMAGAALAMALGLSPALGAQVGKGLTGQSNFANAQAAMSFNVAVADTTAAANNEGVTTAAATTGPSGTGGAAASAAASAAAAAAANGMSAEAQAAAAQAAADATVAGLSPSQAAEQGNAAAVSVGVSEANTAAAEAAPSVAADVGGQAATSGPAAPGGGEAPSVGDSASAAAVGESGVSATGEAAGGAPSGGGADSGSGPGSGDGDGGYAKGGFVSKKKKTTVPKSTSLVSRRK